MTIEEVFLPNNVSYRVVPQPPDDPSFVSKGDVVTQFELAKAFGCIGLLGHVDESGRSFLNLELGSQVTTRHSTERDDAYITYTITEIVEVRAHDPLSPLSEFSEIHTGTHYKAPELFLHIYQGSKLVLQTCIEKEGDEAWGRRFAIAR